MAAVVCGPFAYPPCLGPPSAKLARSYRSYHMTNGSTIRTPAFASLSLDALLRTTDHNPPRLVVLSSCDTGHHIAGSAPDEFIGLPLGFLQLGAGGVLATRWPVSDVATALFVSAFMTSHILRQSSRIRAARRSVLSTRGNGRGGAVHRR